MLRIYVLFMSRLKKKKYEITTYLQITSQLPPPFDAVSLIYFLFFRFSQLKYNLTPQVERRIHPKCVTAYLYGVHKNAKHRQFLSATREKKNREVLSGGEQLNIKARW